MSKKLHYALVRTEIHEESYKSRNDEGAAISKHSYLEDDLHVQIMLYHTPTSHSLPVQHAVQAVTTAQTLDSSSSSSSPSPTTKHHHPYTLTHV